MASNLDKAVELSELDGKLTPWEDSFLESVFERLDDGDELPEGTQEKLDEIYAKHCE